MEGEIQAFSDDSNQEGIVCQQQFLRWVCSLMLKHY